MPRHPARQARACCFLLAAAAALAGPPVAVAGDEAPPTVISTRRPPTPAPKPAGVVQFDAYRGFDPPGPAPGPPPAGAGKEPRDRPRGTPMEIGVAAALATCPDGNAEVSGLDVGGWRYQPDGVCANSSAPPQGAVTVHQDDGRPAPPPAADQAKGAAAPKGACDPATWTCRPAGP